MKEYKIYCHTNKYNGKRYVGLTRTSVQHRWDNGNGYKNNRHFWGAIQKYGWGNFRHEILHFGLTREEASDLERKLIDEWKLTDERFGYNLTTGGEINYTVTEETRKLIGASKRTHGCTKTRLYKTYNTMITSHTLVCEEWGDFIAFREWALANGYSDNLALCRIDAQKEFCPSNCVFQPTSKQHDYRFDKVEVEYNGEMHNFKELGKILGLSRGTLFSRYYSGVTGDELFAPVTRGITYPKYIEKHGCRYRARFKRNDVRYSTKQCDTIEEAAVERDKLLQELNN